MEKTLPYILSQFAEFHMIISTRMAPNPYIENIHPPNHIEPESLQSQSNQRWTSLQ